MHDNIEKLVISPHADDEVLGCSAILDANTYVFYVGVDDFHVVDRKTRLAEIEAVSSFFGFKWEVGDFTVNKYYEDLFRLIQTIEEVIRKITPRRIYIPTYSYNQDHRTIHDACHTALRHHDRNYFVPQVLIYEGVDSFLWEVRQFKPNYFIPLDIERKLHGNSLHKSQLRAHRSSDIIRTMALIRGTQSCVVAAEAFCVARFVEVPLPK